MLFAEAGRGTDERAEPGIFAAGQNHRAIAFRRDLVIAGAVVNRVHGSQGSGVSGSGGLASVFLLERGFDQAQFIDDA
jgi:hypothetical protein